MQQNDEKSIQFSKTVGELVKELRLTSTDKSLNKLADEYEVMVVPTLLFIKDGEIIHRESGFFSKDKFMALVEAYMK